MFHCIEVAVFLFLNTSQASKPEPAPEPRYDEVRLMTRAGPKWVKKQKEPVRVRVVDKSEKAK